MQFIGVDLGSTNLKAAAYDGGLRRIAWESAPVVYDRHGEFVEFDAERYCASLKKLLAALTAHPGVKPEEVVQLSFTGQAESLVILDRDGRPLMNAISWMDGRSQGECRELAERFDAVTCEAVTGQRAVLPTWPATKILWLRRNRPEIYGRAARYMLLKDYVIYALTGVMEADCSIATFSFYFDIYNRRYWKEMLDAIGVSCSQLPPLAEPCTAAGTLTERSARETGLPGTVKVNRGTLDHFAGMVGTGNVGVGGVSLSTGTVMALSAMAREPVTNKNSGVAMHYGFIPGTHVMLPVAESGGASLEWFRGTCMKGVSYDEINRVLARRALPGKVLFLPYIVGTNAPEFDPAVSGAFYGLRAEHDMFDMAGAVMAGIACLLRKNCDALRAAGAGPDHIIATGGGAGSPVLCRLQADITGLPVTIPAEREAACFGAAIIAAVSEGVFASYAEAAEKLVRTEIRYEPRRDPASEKYYKKFCALYDAAAGIAAMD